MLELMIASSDPDTFVFDASALSLAAIGRWPHARSVRPQDRLADLVEVFFYLPAEDGSADAELSVHAGGGALGLDAGSVPGTQPTVGITAPPGRTGPCGRPST